MSNRPHNELPELVREQAAEWLVCLQAGELSSSDRLKYVRWLKRSPVHVRAMLELASLEGQLRSSDLSGMAPHGKPPASDAMAVVIDLDRWRGNASRAFAKPRWYSWQQWKSAASACLSRIRISNGQHGGDPAAKE
ncbi:FecR/PupR family sigma factor regulator [Steroidobacter sp.]|uniref:FecR/PupR family sigma factor regulator n=1 Tax=Steroidobacter sp. TaxID=1978227 RepID=UPI0039C9AFF9